MSYIGQHVREGQAVRTSYTASGGESSVNVTYTIGQLSVFLNGVKLVENVDYTAQNGISVTSISPTLVADDVMEFIALDTFTAADMVPASTGGTFSGNVTVTGDIIPSTPLSHRNMIINGAMNVSQRGTANDDQSTSGIYRVDRMNVGLSSIGEFRLSQETLTSGNAFANGFTKAFRIDCAVADASPAAGDIANMTYKMEGNTVQSIKKGTDNAEKVTLSFWVRCSKTGTAQVNLFAGSRMVSGTYAISSANTWEQKIITFPADTTGAIANDNSKGMELEWALDGGSDFTTGSVQTSWGAQSNVNRSVNDFAIQDNTANDWAITGVQFELGSSATPFEHRSYGDELEACKRYYQEVRNCQTTARENTSTRYRINHSYVREMRDVPALARTSNNLSFNGSGTSYASSATTQAQGATISNNCFIQDFGGFSGLPDGGTHGATADVAWTMDAEL